MSRTKFELNLKGINELMKRPEVLKAQEEAGRQVLDAAKSMSNGAYYKMATHEGNYINFVNVYTGGISAMVDNDKYNTLLKALSAAGLRMD